MKVLLRALWLEPAAFLGTVQGCLQVVQVLVVHDRAANAAIAAALVALGAGGTRKLVRPVRRP
jgi:cyanate permease